MKLKPTNHMRPPGGGAFPLPSVGWVPLPDFAADQTCAAARQKAIQADQGHGRSFGQALW
jgi:hypothetical protein